METPEVLVKRVNNKWIIKPSNEVGDDPPVSVLIDFGQILLIAGSEQINTGSEITEKIEK